LGIGTPGVPFPISERRTGVLALTAALSVVLGACTGGSSSTNAASPSASVESPATSSAQRPFAIWPEDTRPEALAAEGGLANGKDPWRKDAEKTARRFARVVLGWKDADIHDCEGPTRCRNCVIVERRDDAASVIVAMRRLLADRWWSVTWVGEEKDYGFGISVRGSKVTMGFDLQGAASVSIIVGYGEHDMSKTVMRTSTTLDLGFDPNRSGHVLLLFRDRKGKVFSAEGSSLPGGDFVAG
jgi:hypothetical protein